MDYSRIYLRFGRWKMAIPRSSSQEVVIGGEEYQAETYMIPPLGE